MNSIDTAIALKPRPFCGSDDLSRNQSMEVFWIECEGCGINQLVADSFEEAAIFWNTRADKDKHKELLERFDKWQKRYPTTAWIGTEQLMNDMAKALRGEV